MVEDTVDMGMAAVGDEGDGVVEDEDGEEVPVFMEEDTEEGKS